MPPVSAVIVSTPVTRSRLADLINQTIDEELVNELRFLTNYDETKRALQEIIDMPDRLVDLFIQLCLQNNGRLSARKKAAHFSFLTVDHRTVMRLDTLAFGVQPDLPRVV